MKNNEFVSPYDEVTKTKNVLKRLLCMIGKHKTLNRWSPSNSKYIKRCVSCGKIING
jgi:hypothetical protein